MLYCFFCSIWLFFLVGFLMLFIARTRQSFVILDVGVSLILSGFLPYTFYFLTSIILPLELIFISPLIIFVIISTAYFLFLRRNATQSKLDFSIKHTKKITEDNENLKLLTNLIPRSCWGKNARTIEPYKSNWERISKITLEKTNKCEVCGKENQPNIKFECHEEWIFDLENNVQKLKKIMSLCSMCHKVKHIGKTMRSSSENMYIEAKKHMATVNRWSKVEVEKHINNSLEQINLLNKVETWSRDMTYLDNFLNNNQPKNADF